MYFQNLILGFIYIMQVTREMTTELHLKLCDSVPTAKGSDFNFGS